MLKSYYYCLKNSVYSHVNDKSLHIVTQSQLLLFIIYSPLIGSETNRYPSLNKNMIYIKKL